MRAIIVIVAALLVGTVSVAALSVQPVKQPAIASVVPYRPGLLEVQQAGLYSSASTDSTNLLQ